MAIRVLSIDGGGIRGVFAAQLIYRLNERTDFLKNIDVFVGTSTGAIIAAGLALEMPPEELVNLYETEGRTIFKATPPGSNVITAKYSSASLRNTLQKRFAIAAKRALTAKYRNADDPELKKSLGHESFPYFHVVKELGKRLIIPAFSLWEPRDAENVAAKWQPVVFHNLDFTEPSVDETLWDPFHYLPVKFTDDRLSDIVARSCAAPTYFPAVQGFIDGGVVANNPSLLAYTLLKDSRVNMRDQDDIRIISVSTGGTLDRMEFNIERNWGLLRWGTRL